MATRTRRTMAGREDQAPSRWLVPSIDEVSQTQADAAAEEAEPPAPPPEYLVGATPPKETRTYTTHRPGGRHLFTWVSAHGGAGGTSLARASGQGADLSGEWPDPALGWPSAVVVVARSNAAGLGAAAELVREVASGRVRGLEVVALVVVADAPLKPTKEHKRRLHELSGAVPTVLTVPWISQWREHPYTPHPAVTTTAAQVATLTTTRENRS